MVSWILACALNIHTLILAIDELPHWFHDKIFHLENLKNLDTRIRKTSNLKQVTFVTFLNFENAANALVVF